MRSMKLKHKWLALVPSKGRPDEFAKKCKPLLETLPIDSAVLLEASDYDKYDYPNKILLDKENQGIGYAIHFARLWAEENGYDVIFKIDDDVGILRHVRTVLSTPCPRHPLNRCRSSFVGGPT